jgi:hypothetical protein
MTDDNSALLSKRITEFQREINQFCDKELPKILDRNSGSLFTNLSDTLAKGIIYDVFVPRIKAWRDSRIESLNKLEADIFSTAKSWLQKDETTRDIESVVTTWLRDKIAPEIDREVKQICNRYGIPEESFNGRLTSALTANSGVFTGNISVADQLAEAIAFFSNLLLYSLLAGTVTISTLILGPLGLIISMFVSLIGAVLGKSAVESWVKEANLWTWIRQLAISEEKVQEIAGKERPNVEEKIRTMFNQDPALKQKLIEPFNIFLARLVREVSNKIEKLAE